MLKTLLPKKSLKFLNNFFCRFLLQIENEIKHLLHRNPLIINEGLLCDTFNTLKIHLAAQITFIYYGLQKLIITFLAFIFDSIRYLIHIEM